MYIYIYLYHEMRVFKLSEARSMIRRLMLARKRGLSWISMYSLVQLLEQICLNSIISNLKLQAIPSLSLSLCVSVPLSLSLSPRR